MFQYAGTLHQSSLCMGASLSSNAAVVTPMCVCSWLNVHRDTQREAGHTPPPIRLMDSRRDLWLLCNFLPHNQAFGIEGSFQGPAAVCTGKWGVWTYTKVLGVFYSLIQRMQ